MPARTAHAIGTVPLGVIGLGRLGALPEHEIQWIFLAIEHGHAFARVQLVQRLAGKLSVTGEFAHGVVHIAILGAVGQALALEFFDDVQHLRDVIGCAGLVRRALDTKGIGVLMQRLDHAIGQAADGFAVFQGAPDDLVFNVRHVAHIVDRKATRTQPALDDIERNHRSGMPEMAEVIHGHAAHVHAHLTRYQRGKLLQCTRQRVIDSQAHGKHIGVLSVCSLRRCSGRPRGTQWEIQMDTQLQCIGVRKHQQRKQCLQRIGMTPPQLQLVSV